MRDTNEPDYARIVADGMGEPDPAIMATGGDPAALEDIARAIHCPLEVPMIRCATCGEAANTVPLSMAGTLHRYGPTGHDFVPLEVCPCDDPDYNDPDEHDERFEAKIADQDAGRERERAPLRYVR